MRRASPRTCAPSPARPAPSRDGAIDEPLLRLRRVIEALHTSARTVERRTGITNAQLFMLHAVKTHPGAGVGELARLAHVQQSTASIVVRRLERADLVRRVRDRADERRVVVQLTAGGRKVLRRAPLPPTACLLTALRTLSPRSRTTLARGLAALEHALGITAVEGRMLFEHR